MRRACATVAVAVSPITRTSTGATTKRLGPRHLVGVSLPVLMGVLSARRVAVFVPDAEVPDIGVHLAWGATADGPAGCTGGSVSTSGEPGMRSVAVTVAHEETPRVVTDARARTLAGYWQDAHDPDGPLARLARDGTITGDTIAALSRDLETLEALTTLPSALRDQLRELLAYVGVHGERGPVAGWDGLRDPARYRPGASAPTDRARPADEGRRDDVAGCGRCTP